MGGSSSKASTSQNLENNFVNKSSLNLLNSTINSTIVNTTIKNVKQCSAVLLQNQNIKIIGLNAGGDITITSQQVQQGMLNFACAQSTDVYNNIMTEVINTIMDQLSSSVNNNVLNDLNAQASAKSTDQWGSFPWGGADSSSDTSQEVRNNITNVNNKTINNVVKNAVSTNFTNKNYDKCISKVIGTQEFLARDLTAGRNITLTLNQDQSTKVFSQCIQSSKVSNFITQNIADFFGLTIRDDVSNSATNLLSAESLAESLKGGPLGLFSDLLSGLLPNMSLGSLGSLAICIFILCLCFCIVCCLCSSSIAAISMVPKS